MGVQLHVFLTFALDGVNGQIHAPATLLPVNQNGIHLTGRGVGPKYGLDALVKT
jgi:hypothetical protein